ncbi:MAG: aminotransferase class I/II-fold pyridoxal phosphate-dependent enzyme, partial [Deinococcus sp.]|nr:aminotransferase class I/II-fold pyridoxal phosphate-dependent enzyme [Deinococcus sp.]
MGTSVYPVHGGLNLVELRSLGVDPSDVLDFSASINPLGLPHGVVEAMAKVDITTYPDRQCLKLREALAAHLNVELAQILVGNGSTELIHLLARAYLSKDDRAFIFAPTFGEYEAACMKVEAAVYNFKAKEATGFHWDLDAGLSAIQEQDPRLVFLCNPNNPT